MGYLKPVQEYKADYYIKNYEKYRERNRLYREKQKAIKAGTYVEPVKPTEPIVEPKKPKQIIVFF
jgi:hypothetical protein